MLKVETKFPFVGSIAAYGGMRWRVISHNADGTATRRLCIFIEEHLRGRNEVILGLLVQVLAFNARKGIIPGHHDNAHVAQCMRHLGWRKQGYFGAGRDRSPIYVRPAVMEKAA